MLKNLLPFMLVLWVSISLFDRTLSSNEQHSGCLLHMQSHPNGPGEPDVSFRKQWNALMLCCPSQSPSVLFVMLIQCRRSCLTSSVGHNLLQPCVPGSGFSPWLALA